MKSNYYFAVEDMLIRKNFEHAKVVAGKKGLKRQVKWVHVVEVTSIKNLLNGNELILSTGIALKEEDVFLSLINQLIACDAAALCIELNTNISSIPESVISCAEQSDFPIVVFQKEVPFVSITQDIHSVLINQQYEMIKKLESYAQELNKRLLGVNHFRDILKVLHNELGTPVLFHSREEEVEIFPRMCPAEHHRLTTEFHQHGEGEDSPFASLKVNLFDQEYAELSIYRNGHPFSEYELLILDRTSTALAQFLMRELYFTEQKRLEDSKWIMSWLKGEQSHDRLEQFIAELKSAIHGGVVSICETGMGTEPFDITYFNLATRSIFEQYGFHVVPERMGDSLIFILLDTRRRQDWKTRIKHAYEKILQSDLFKGTLPSVFVTGKYENDLMDIHKSYATAKESLTFRNKMGGEDPYYFFDDLHLFRLISVVHSNVNLWDMIEEYLSPLLAYDQKHDGNLMHTLKVFLSCQGSKQETSKQLFIVRQTLYHRLKKIEDLLGGDFMASDKRVAIEFLLASYEFLQPEASMKKRKVN
ncbi:PucR family transcriptional regulator [Bacillus sp. KH172YL63]|uniref:PucR family transcriptional regulator n=1 Tax=Bacillus sp. KH172YL63 TaxID=2709784 RepID=UPI0013E4AFBB|nr:PucR family transcriptional regulator [Bacillus sp. KH172YL63]BCB03470.1 hypothetical protein KH172YL63_16030 [Bacillus sp. KH172YL63]